ncbi:MAG: hypothetical protein V1645_01665 [archaeon]
MKKRFLIVLLATIILLTAAANADTSNFSIQKSYDWLLKQQSNGSFGGTLETSASILALKAAGYDPTTPLNYLAGQENTQPCWPKASCRTKETAFVILAYKSMGVSTEDQISWLKSAQSAALQSGNWWLEVATTDTGTCSIKYTKNSQDVTKTIKVNAGRFTDCGNTTFMNLNTCIETNFVKNFPTIDMYIDCGDLDNALISLIYNSANSYYILTDSASQVAEITIENGCFGMGYKDPSCNYDSTLYSNWAFILSDESTSSKMYLRDNYDETNTVHNAFLFLILDDDTYLQELRSRQRSDGSWDSDVYRTAIALLALKGQSEYSTEFSEGVEWLKTKQRTDGSFGDVTTTAMVLYAAFTEGEIEFPSCTNEKRDDGERGIDCGGTCEAYDDCCSNNEKDQDEDGIDCGGACIECTEVVCNGDDVCDTDQGEDCHNCPEDCNTCEDLCSNGVQDEQAGEEGVDCGGQCSDACAKAVCDKNGVCDIDLIDRGYDENENSENCPEDCSCGDAVCDDTESYSTCPDDCVEPVEGCGDGTCDETTETSETCPDDCGEPAECNNDGTCDQIESCDCADCAETDICAPSGGGFPWMWVLLLLVILLAVVGYLIYKKNAGKKRGKDLFGFGTPILGKKPEMKDFKSFGPIKEIKPAEKRPSISISTPSRPALRSEPSKVERELESSIKEAKKLIGKK